nr:CBS domain-containing protein [Nitrosopumilus sp.]
TTISAVAIKIMIVITYPLVLLSALITKAISGKKEENTISREEISILAHLGMKEGIFDESENKIIQNLILLKKLHVKEIMTPRVVVNTADENLPLQDFIHNKKIVHSRIPVYSGNRENITGYVFRNTVFEKLIIGEKNLKLTDIKREMLILPNTKPVFGVWETLLENKEQIALLVDEYGGMDGIVTMEDIIETLIGFEIVDEKDVVKDMQDFARERWKKLMSEAAVENGNKG